MDATKNNLKYLKVEIKNENARFGSMLRLPPRCQTHLAFVDLLKLPQEYLQLHYLRFP